MVSFVALLESGLEFGGGGAEGEARTVEVGGPLEVPGIVFGRLPRLPRLDGIDLIERR